MIAPDRLPLTIEELWERTAESETLISRLMGSEIEIYDDAIFSANVRNPYTMANRIYRIRATTESIEQLLDRGFAFFRSAKTSPHFQVSQLSRPDDLGSRLLKRGLRRMPGGITVLAHDLACGCFPGMANNSMESFAQPLHQSHLNIQIEPIPLQRLYIWIRVFEQGFDTDATHDMIATWQRSIESGNASFYLARAGAEPAGTAILFRENGTGAISTISTLPHWRQHGIATALVRRCVADSIRCGDDLLTISADSETAAERLYRNIGFHPIYRAHSYMY